MSVSTMGRAAPASEPGREAASPLIDPRGEAPIRAELFGIEHLEEHARRLAAACRLAPPARRPSPLLERFAENGVALARAHREILAGFDRREGRGLDAEWLVDNYPVVDDVLREIKQDLPSGYDAELPKLAVEPLEGYPRVFALALALVAHTDSGFDEARVTRFVDTFQSVAPLTIGELWAVPTMLRLVLLENLRRLADEMIRGRAGRSRADAWAAAHLEASHDGTVARALPAIDTPPRDVESAAYVVRLLELLHDQGPGAAAALDRIATDLRRHAVDPDELLREEHCRQAVNQVSIGNAVTSLRLLAALDWNAFFERSSRVETVLREDPAGLYTRQDFFTRDRTRQAVERIAKGSGLEEVEVARRAVARAGLAAGTARGTVGYYLLDKGVRDFEDELRYRPKGREGLLRFVLGHPRLVYFGSIGLLTAALVAPLAALGLGAGPWMVALIALALLIPASEVAIGIMHHVLTLTLPPRVLPKLDFRDGIAADCPTFVVMPSMLVRPESAAALLERLEIHFLANPDPMLRFALLTDFADAPEEHRPEDEGYVRSALEGVAELNRRYAPAGPDKFFLFHRKRLWNPKQGVWMGWERKRGKLSEFNRLLLGARDTSYSHMSVDPAHLPPARFVITLDADTMLIRDTARRLVGAIAHPLNLPVFDAERGRVVEGFGVLQPRVSIHLSGASRSRFTRILASSAGIDPYSTAVSDVYMDLFDTGSFTGKGVYEVRAFEAATGRTFPENQILSHDLIEGNYARCGLVSDIELFDDFPARYHAYARREHRWVRGDWQLLPWLAPRVPTPDGPRPNPLPAPERWKVFDNLRRSLVPPSVVLLLVLGWAVLPGPAWLWTLLALAVAALPLVQQISGALIGAVRKGSLAPLGALRDVPATAMQSALSIAFLADQARLLVDAIAQTLVRLSVTHRRMLEWETAAATERRLGTGAIQFFQTMWPAPAMALGFGALVAAVNPAALPAAAPVLVAWLGSPLVAYWVSQPGKKAEEPLTEDERDALRRIARRTWRFFETFVGDADHWLPPDNFQEEGGDRVAHRTSPTNKGLLLLSTLAAHDLGYLGLRALVDRLEKTMATLEELGRHRGHFYNWYRTDTLEPLPPAYISTVDSGNMLACLVALRGGLRELAAEPIVGPAAAKGLADSAGLALESLRSAKASVAPRGYAATEAALLDLVEKLGAPPADVAGWDEWLGSLEWDATEALGRARAMPDNDADRADGLVFWLRAFEETVREHRADLAALGGGESGAPASLLGLAPRVPAAADLLARARKMSDRAGVFIKEMDFAFLYKDDRHLFSIGANLAQDRLDASCYDLLASESALTSYLAVARGEVPKRHWFQLNRPYIRVAGRIGLLSWGGTMFEYLMPRLLMRTLPGTLIDLMIRATVARQVEYGRQTGVPWGISESGFAAQYPDGDYQYQSFGVPGLGLKRGLARDLVVAPYATALAAMVEPREALANFRRLEDEGGLGHYGFYEALDYTPERLEHGERRMVVRSYMAHHQGMSLIALANATLGDPMPRRFHLSSVVRSSELLLQERVPREVPLIETPDADETPDLTLVDGRAAAAAHPPMIRRIGSASTPSPRTHLLSNGHFAVMITNAGAGYSTCGDLDVTRWREDATRDCWGEFVYVRDLASGVVWSAGYQPTRKPPDDYEVVFSADKASFRRRDEGIETKMEVTVTPERDAELRRVTLTNFGATPRELDVTSYAEVVLGPRGADLAHPAFNKLFLETEWLADVGAILARRRPRSDDQEPTWALHASSADAGAGAPEFETDRAKFLGRGRTPASPAALDPGATLSGSVGAVLDPIFSIRRRVHLEPGGSAMVAFGTAMVRDRDEALVLAALGREPSNVARAFDMAWAQSQVEHRHRRWSPEEAVRYQRLGAHLVFAGPAQRSDPGVIASNTMGQPGLWRAGVSGDRPIALVRLMESEELPLAAEVLDAHAYLRHKGLHFDLVLLDERPSSYNDVLHEEMMDLVRSSHSADAVDQPGGVFVRDADALGPEVTTLLQAAARVVLVGGLGPLAAQLDRVERPRPLPSPLETARDRGSWEAGELAAPADLAFANGLGGFTPDGREYVVLVRAAENPALRRNGKPKREPAPRLVLPPAPWVNVVANPAGGFIVSEAGSGYTWAANSQANRLTPWSNDPVSDPPGEVVYLRDEDTGAVWCPTPLPVADAAPVLVRHGQGYTTFERRTHGLDHALTLFVPHADPVKVVRLALTNHGEAARRVSATYYAEWVLGTIRGAFTPYIVTEVDEETGALLARNPYNADFAGRVAFLDVDRRPRSLTGDRGEFLGRNGSVAMPAAMARAGLSGRVGAGLDPCGAVQAVIELAPGESTELVFLIGQGDDLKHAREIIRRHRDPAGAANELEAAKAEWDGVLGAIEVKTPDPALDLMVNRWLIYQALSCRVWGRSAFYQSGGAFGFRDQLQDSMALVYGAPAEARAQLLRSASRQFVEGDVQHWWHPPTGVGVRTRISDDYLWLPYVAAHYVTTTGDGGVLDEVVPFLDAPKLRPDQEEDYGKPAVSQTSATLYEHCTLALERGTSLIGEHGLPLMGTGDWNDGMNRVGDKMKGESVWLGWFLIAGLTRFATLSGARGDSARAEKFKAAAESLRAAVEKSAWDGDWYRRAYFDDGTPLGSAQNDECRIDSIAQSWAVISGAGEPERAGRAMAEVDAQLVKADDRMILLFTPPFDHGKLHPGYIKGYVPGIRENGGQYTHAATWTVLAAAMQGRGDHAHALLDMLNPVRHAADPEGVERYKVEPYVVVADVYSCPPHVGRGGWTWYTGSASWLWRVAVEDVLGFHLRGDRLFIEPCLPKGWPGFELTYRYRSATYRVVVERGAASVALDGRIVEGRAIPLADDGHVHEVRVVLSKDDDNS